MSQQVPPTVEWSEDDGGMVRMIDQTKLPDELVMLDCAEVECVARAIERLSVRGAPAIGCAAALGMALAGRRSEATNLAMLLADLKEARDRLAATRPTAVNLFWALGEMDDAIEAAITLQPGGDIWLMGPSLTADPDDVRMALLRRAEHIEHALVVLFTVGGIPSIYAGDEFGLRAVKEDRDGGDDAVRPEFVAALRDSGGGVPDVLNLHRYLIGLRRRHPWLHEARTEALHLDNRTYAYRSRSGEETLIVALNVEDDPVPLPVAELTGGPAEILAGAGAPPLEKVSQTLLPPHGWLVLAPR